MSNDYVEMAGPVIPSALMGPGGIPADKWDDIKDAIHDCGLTEVVEALVIGNIVTKLRGYNPAAGVKQ